MAAIAIVRNRPVYYDTFKCVWRYKDTGNEVAPSRK